MARINYTGRKRIVREKIRLRLTEDGAVRLHADTLDLNDLNLPPHARIVIEAQRQTRFARLACGTVAEPELPRGVTLLQSQRPRTHPTSG